MLSSSCRHLQWNCAVGSGRRRLSRTSVLCVETLQAQTVLAFVAPTPVTPSFFRKPPVTSMATLAPTSLPPAAGSVSAEALPELEASFPGVAAVCR